MQNRRVIVLMAVATLVLAALACGPPEEGTTEVPTATPQDTGEVTPSPTSPAQTSPPSPTETPVPDIPGPGGCTLNAAYVADVTVPDNTQMSPGESFNKTWRVRNTGTCDWEAGTVLVFSSGDRMGGPNSVPAGAIAPNATIDVSVNLTAPGTPGTYRGNWQLEAPDGTRFGLILYVQIVVPAPATATPSPTQEPSATPSVPPTESGCVAVDPALAPILQHAQNVGYDIGCPVTAAFETWGALQEFWANVDHVSPHMHFRSLMIWREDNREIYVIDGVDTNASAGMLMAYSDTWAEGDPEVHPDCAGMTVPTGYQLPIRGFGKVWCVNDLVDLVGWPGQSEEGATMLVQPTQTGLLLRMPAGLGYLLALDYRAVYAVTTFIP
jgi:hypothetical protein